MGNILRVLVVAAALAATVGATSGATDTPPSESLVATASSLGQKALNDPAAFDFVASLTTEIGQRLAGTEAHRRAVAWAEARLKAAGRLPSLSLPLLSPPAPPCGDPRTTPSRSCSRVRCMKRSHRSRRSQVNRVSCMTAMRSSSKRRFLLRL